MRRFDQLFLGVVGTIFLGLGTINLFFPVAGMAGFEMQITSVSALNEIRAKVSADQKGAIVEAMSEMGLDRSQSLLRVRG